MSEFVVPVSDAIVDFERHLEAYPRTILSAKFGDGKSYFLQKVKDDPDINEKYAFLTIYPVNYQVVGNKDIFEIIKRDVLFQLILHDMISCNVRLTDSEAFSWFIFRKGGSLLMDIVSYFAEVGLEQEDSTKVINVAKGLKLFKDLKEKFAKYRQKNFKTDDDYIDAFLDKADTDFIYENDVITQIIRKAIADYQRRTKKKVVLFVEDMDRIDPAHLFRILNVLSAHMDFCYKHFVKPDKTLIGNKFGLDNIVPVLDFHNLKNIYRHFYGEHTDFHGYISKFLSGVPFYYSLEKQKYKYVVNRLVEITGLDSSFIKSVFTKETLASKTMRETVQSFDIQHCIKSAPIVTYEGKDILLDTSFLRLMAIMRRQKWTDDEISDFMLKVRLNDLDMFVCHVLPYMFLTDDKNIMSLSRSVDLRTKDYGLCLVQMNLDPEKGTVSSGRRTYSSGDAKESDFLAYLQKMLSWIV